MTGTTRHLALAALLFLLAELPAPLGPLADAQPGADRIRVRTNGGEAYNSKVQNVVHTAILPNAKFDAASMWHSDELGNDLWVWLEFTFPQVVTLSAIRLHTEHEQRWHEANAVRVEVAAGNSWRELTRGGIDSDDALISFDATAATVWRVHLMADHQKRISVRGVQFYNGQQELYPPPSAPAPHPALAGRPLRFGNVHALPVGATLASGSEITDNFRIRRPSAPDATSLPVGRCHTHRETQTVTAVDAAGVPTELHIAAGDSCECPAVSSSHSRNGRDRNAGRLDQRDYRVTRSAAAALQTPAATAAELAVMQQRLNWLVDGDPFCRLLPDQFVAGRSYRIAGEAAQKVLLECFRIPLEDDSTLELRNVEFGECQVRVEDERMVDGVRELHIALMLSGSARTVDGMTLTFEVTGAMGIDADRRIRRWYELGGPLVASGAHKGTGMAGSGWLCVNSFSELSMTPPPPPPDANSLACPERVRMLPVFYVPRDAPMPTTDMIERFIAHVRLAQKRYAELLDGDTFEVASWQPAIVRGRYSAASQFMRDQWSHPELLERSGYTRFNCPYVMLIVNWSPWEPAIVAGGRPYNGSLNAGGGIAEYFRGPLSWASVFQKTTQHEIGHAVGMHHVEVFGYPQNEGGWLMSYGPETYWKFLDTQADGVQRVVRPENLEQASWNHRVFTKFRFDPARHIPAGYDKKSGDRPYGEAPLIGSPPWMFTVRSDIPSAYNSAPGNLERHRLETNRGPNGYVSGNMWHTDTLADNWCWLDVTFPMVATLSTIRLHTQHSLRYHQAVAWRIEVLQRDGTRREVGKGDISSDDHLATFPTSTARVWRIWLKADDSKKVVVRGLQFYWGRREIIPPPWFVPEHPGLAALPHPPAAPTTPTTTPAASGIEVRRDALPAGATITSSSHLKTDLQIKVLLNGQQVNDVHQTQDQAHNETATVVTAARQFDFVCRESGTTMQQAGQSSRTPDPREKRACRVTRNGAATTTTATSTDGAPLDPAAKLAIEQRVNDLVDGDPVAATLPDRIDVGKSYDVPADAAFRAFIVGGDLKVTSCRMTLIRVEQTDGLRVGVFSLTYAASGEIAPGVTLGTNQSGEYRIDLDRRIRLAAAISGPATMKGSQQTADGLIGYEATGTMSFTETNVVRLK
ncbi:MAG: hypothetical protein AB7K09_00215 [Planctomycetota bacterium]